MKLKLECILVNNTGQTLNEPATIDRIAKRQMPLLINWFYFFEELCFLANSFIIRYNLYQVSLTIGYRTAEPGHNSMILS